MPYFDNNATTPLDAGARQALLDAYTESWANPSSPLSLECPRSCFDAKMQGIGILELRVRPDHMIFTSGATEANNSVFSRLSCQTDRSARVLLSPFEHPAFQKPLITGS